MIVSYRDFLPCCPYCNTVRNRVVQVVGVYLTYQLIINQKPKLFPPVRKKASTKLVINTGFGLESPIGWGRIVAAEPHLE